MSNYNLFGQVNLNFLLLWFYLILAKLPLWPFFKTFASFPARFGLYSILLLAKFFFVMFKLKIKITTLIHSSSEPHIILVNLGLFKKKKILNGFKFSVDPCWKKIFCHLGCCDSKNGKAHRLRFRWRRQAHGGRRRWERSGQRQGEPRAFNRHFQIGRQAPFHACCVQERAAASGPRLFGSSEDEEDGDEEEDGSRFHIRPQFEGEAGQKVTSPSSWKCHRISPWLDAHPEPTLVRLCVRAACCLADGVAVSLWHGQAFPDGLSFLGGRGKGRQQGRVWSDLVIVVLGLFFLTPWKSSFHSPKIRTCSCFFF